MKKICTWVRATARNVPRVCQIARTWVRAWIIGFRGSAQRHFTIFTGVRTDARANERTKRKTPKEPKRDKREPKIEKLRHAKTAGQKASFEILPNRC